MRLFVKTKHLLGLATLACHYHLSVLVAAETTVPSAYTVPGAFPTSLYSSYYNNPTATSVQPQPVISDPVTVNFYHRLVT
jgi:hypothetical protein